MIRIKRAYDDPEKRDGFRILVDRLWPRGLSKEKLRIDLWLRDIAPSNQLRRWFSHDQAKWGEFKMRYKEELARKEDLIRQVKQWAREKGTVTFVYSAKDEKHNNAVALLDILKKFARLFIL